MSFFDVKRIDSGLVMQADRVFETRPAFQYGVVLISPTEESVVERHFDLHYRNIESTISRKM
jgi:hypothetical protein